MSGSSGSVTKTSLPTLILLQSIYFHIGRICRSAQKSAADYMDAVRRRVVVTFPGKEVRIGEVGWPKSREDARGRALLFPGRSGTVSSPKNLDRARKEHFQVNLFEACTTSPGNASGKGP